MHVYSDGVSHWSVEGYVDPDTLLGQLQTSTIILQNNNLGIASSTPWGRLSITGSGTGTGIAFVTADAGNNPKFVIQDNGYVGIGTTSPQTILGLQGGIGVNPSQLYLAANGNVAIGTANPSALFDIVAGGVDRARFNNSGQLDFPNASGAGTPSITFGGSNNYSISGNTSSQYLQLNGGNSYLNINNSNIYTLANVGIGTTSPDMLLSVGSNSPSGSVAHFENSTGSCYINPTTTSLSCSSDSRLKTNVVPFDSADGLAAVLQLNPVTYNWKTESGTTSPHTGFIAQDVQPILPDLVSQGPDGYYTLNYAGLTPYLVKAIQEIATITGVFKDNLIAWLGSAGNGIDNLFAVNLHASNELCVGDTCIDAAQFKAMVAATGVISGSAPVLSGSSAGVSGNVSATSTPPAITISGENPATIPVGTTYADLGATITAPQGDVNLGLTIVVDNATSTDGTVQIDTSKPGAHTILYTVTDPSGLTGSATRTVIVTAPQQTPPPANDNITPAANDNSPSDGATGTTGQ